MGKSKDVTPKKGSVILAYAKDGLSYRTIGKKLSISKTAVEQVLKRYQQSGRFSRKNRSGRRRKTTARDDSAMKRAVTINPFITSTEIAASLPSVISARTVRRRLHDDFKLPRRTPARKPFLNKIQRKKRVAFCRRHSAWTVQDWERVLFSDESTFSQFGVRVHGVRRPVNTRYDQRYTVPTMKQPPKIMVWGSFSAHGRGNLYFIPQKETVNAVRYRNILAEKLMTAMTIHGCTIFQQDSAPAHTAKLVKDWLKMKKVSVLEWPGNSPDLNPIENLWNVMKRKVALHAPSNMQDLTYWVKKVWCTEINQELCRKLIHSMPTRIKAVLKRKGCATKY